MKKASTELPIIQKTYDLILWYVPHLNRLPRDHKFMLGNRLIEGLYGLLEGLILARYSTEKLAQLESLNNLLDVIRYQTRLLKDFELIDLRRYQPKCTAKLRSRHVSISLARECGRQHTALSLPTFSVLCPEGAAEISRR